MQLSSNTVIKSCSDGKKQVTLTDCHIGSICTMHSKISYKEWMVRRDRPSSHDRRNHRNLRLFNYFCKYAVRTCNIHTTAGKEQWFLCLFQHFQCTLKLSHMHTRIRLIPTDIHRIRIHSTSEFRHHIFWKINQNRSRSSCSCNIKCLFNDPSQIFPLADRDTIFRNAAGNSYNIYFLKGIISDQRSRYLSCKTHKRYTVIICRGKSGHQIGCPRSARYQTYSDFSRCPCIRICLMNQCLLMSWKDHTDLILLIQLITDIDRAGSRISEKSIDTFLLQSSDK